MAKINNAVDFYNLVSGGIASIVWREERRAYISLEFVPYKVRLKKDGRFKIGGVWYRL